MEKQTMSTCETKHSYGVGGGKSWEVSCWHDLVRILELYSRARFERKRFPFVIGYVKAFFVSIQNFCDLLRWGRKGVSAGHHISTDIGEMLGKRLEHGASCPTIEAFLERLAENDRTQLH